MRNNQPPPEDPTTAPQQPSASSSHTAEEELERDDAIIGVALRWSLVVLAVAALAAGGVYWYATRPRHAEHKQIPTQQAAKRVAPKRPLPRVQFVDVTQAAGIQFVHENGAYGQKLLPETMGGGCAALDYDNDGDQDLLLVNSDFWPWHVPPDRPRPTTALYRNDGNWHFTDVSPDAGLNIACYGMGVAVGDYDNDGWVDVFISAVGRNRLFHNVEGRFVEVTEQAGVAGEEDAWSTACGFFDYDHDGDLDLLVCNYVVWSREIDTALDCRLTGRLRAYCRPDAFAGTFPYLYRNDGQGKFTDVSARAGVQVRNPITKVPLAKSLGLIPVDFDADGWIDFVVANDTVQNLAFRNRGDGTFEELGAERGIAFDANGNARGAMGIDAAYFRNDDALGVAIGNFANEPTALYVTHGRELQFTDDANVTGIGPPSQSRLKFGLFFFDFDLDGRLDVFTANGHLEDEINKLQESQHYEQPPHLFCNCGPEAESEFVLMPPGSLGQDFERPLVGRGALYADFDDDGDLDVLITAIRSPPRLLRNDQRLGHHWLRVKLIGRHCNRDAIGAWIEAHAAGTVQRRQVMPTRSYLSQVELPVTFGLGKANRVDRLIVHWPDGSRQEVVPDGVDRLLVIEQATQATALRSRSVAP